MMQKNTAHEEQASKVKGKKLEKKRPLIVEVDTKEDAIEEYDDREDEDDGQYEEGEQEEDGEAGDSQGRQVQLEFALGDFDETPIAKAEDAATLAANGDVGKEEVEAKGELEILYKEAEDE